MPCILMEYACAEYPNEPIRKRDWLQDVYTWAQNDNVASLLYFNNQNGNGMNSSHLITSDNLSRDEFIYQNTDSKS